jgi:hypothetical protein
VLPIAIHCEGKEMQLSSACCSAAVCGARRSQA